MMKKSIRFTVFFVIMLFLVAVMSSVFVAADKFHVFEKKNEIINVDGHEIILLEVTTDEECIFTINGDGFVIVEGNDDGTDEVEILVKKAIPIRTKDADRTYCEALIDVKIPGKIQPVDQGTIDGPAVQTSPDPALEKQEEESLGTATGSDVDSEDSTQDAQTPTQDSGAETKKKPKGFLAKLIDFIKSLFR